MHSSDIVRRCPKPHACYDNAKSPAKGLLDEFATRKFRSSALTMSAPAGGGCLRAMSPPVVLLRHQINAASPSCRAVTIVLVRCRSCRDLRAANLREFSTLRGRPQDSRLPHRDGAYAHRCQQAARLGPLKQASSMIGFALKRGDLRSTNRRFIRCRKCILGVGERPAVGRSTSMSAIFARSASIQATASAFRDTLKIVADTPETLEIVRWYIAASSALRPSRNVDPGRRIRQGVGEYPATSTSR